MNYQITHLLLRTQAALRLLESLEGGRRRARLASVATELALIERLLSQVIRAPDVLFEEIAIEVLEVVLDAGLGAIATEEARS